MHVYVRNIVHAHVLCQLHPYITQVSRPVCVSMCVIVHTHWCFVACILKIPLSHTTCSTECTHRCCTDGIPIISLLYPMCVYVRNTECRHTCGLDCTSIKTFLPLQPFPMRHPYQSRSLISLSHEIINYYFKSALASYVCNLPSILR